MNQKLPFALLLAFVFAYAPCVQALSKNNKNKKQDIRRLLEKRNILALPNLANQVASFTGKKLVKKSVNKLDSEPPTLEAIASSPIKNIFWREINGINVVDALNNNNFSAPYCAEFLSGANGQSSGLGGCHMAESVAFSYGEIVDSGTALCYMQNFPTKGNLKSGGITIETGKLPDGGIEKLFSVPKGKKARIVKTNIKNSVFIDPFDIYIRVASTSENRASRNIYNVNIWVCAEGVAAPLSLNEITISNSLVFSNSYQENITFDTEDEVAHQSTAFTSGALSKDKSKLIWDSSKTRTARTTYKNASGDFFKSQVEITKDNIITVRKADRFFAYDTKAVVLTRYTGQSAEDLRFLSGAYKQLQGDFSITSAAKYNGSFYAIDDANDLLPLVSAEDLSSEFFTTGVTNQVDTTSFSCGVVPDISLIVDQANPTINSSVTICDDLKRSLENTYFCHEDPEVSSALDKSPMCI